MRKLLNNSLIKNSIYLIINNFLGTGLGFIFWTINANLYSSQEVGVANTLISCMYLVMLITSLGFYFGIIKYMPKHKKSILGPMFSISAILAFLVSMGYGIYLVLTRSDIFPLTTSSIMLFSIFNAAWLVHTLLDAVFISHKQSRSVVYRNLVYSILKIILTMGIFSFMGGFGIFTAWSVAALITIILTLPFVPYKIDFNTDLAPLVPVIRFSLFNYITGFLSSCPYYIIPILISFTHGVRETAYYSIAFMFATILFNIPKAIGQSLFAENSTKLDNKNMIKSFGFSLAIVIAGIVFILIFGKLILTIFGREYVSESITLLKILVFAGIPACVIDVYSAVVNIRNQMKRLVISNLALSVLLISSALVLGNMGLIGYGIAWVFSYSLVAAGMLIDLFKNG